MKLMSLAILISLAGFSALALDGPAEVVTSSPKAAQLAKALAGRSLKCDPVTAAADDSDRYPLTVKATLQADGKTSITVADVKGEDGMSNCGCVVSRYKGDTLRLRDGDDDNYMDLKFKINPAQLDESKTIEAIDEALDDSFQPWKQRPLNCRIVQIP